MLTILEHHRLQSDDRGLGTACGYYPYLIENSCASLQMRELLKHHDLYHYLTHVQSMKMYGPKTPSARRCFMSANLSKFFQKMTPQSLG